MNPATFRAIRIRAGLSQSGLAALLRVEDVRTIRRYELGERAVSGPVSLLMELIDTGWRP
jgi:DNA-binding transcriptional regulator YiaG